jgi:hypothetical protein
MPHPHTRAPSLQPLRFGEFLRERNLITEEQWLAALAKHWSTRGSRIGSVIVDCGFLSEEIVEAEAQVFHEDLDVVEIDTRRPGPRRTPSNTRPLRITR